MNLTQLKKTLKVKLQPLGRRVQIMYPCELFRMKYKKQLEVRFATESYLISFSKDKWKVAFSERGTTLEEEVFTQESEACEYLNEMIDRVL